VAVAGGVADTVALGDRLRILQARQTNDVVRQDFKFARTMVRGLAESGITSLVEHPEHEWPVIRADRNHGQASTHLRTGFLTFAIDELDKLRGAYSREHEFARDRWRLRRLGFTGDEAGWTLNFCGIQQPWRGRRSRSSFGGASTSATAPAGCTGMPRP
jgi:hypothetical protein